MRTPDEALRAEKKQFEKAKGNFKQEDESNWEADRDQLVERVDQFLADHFKGSPVSIGSKACRKAVDGAKTIIENAGWSVKVTWDGEEKERVLIIQSAFSGG
jgi:hypothetical protein